jgi:hypothetical protein
MDRERIFDALRGMLGGRLTQAQVDRIDHALDTANGADRPAARLGALSERFECGGRGPGAVSSGRNDPGGVSYGLYQLASRTGTCASFMAAEGKQWAARFGEASPGSDAFSAVWRAIAAEEAEAFAAAQHAFIERTHYRPAVAAVLAETGLDLDGCAPAVRDAAWSTAVQHGAAARLLAGAVRTADALSPRGLARYDRALVEAIYAARVSHVRKVAARPGTPPAQRRLLESLVANRYASERSAALAMLER